MNDMAAANRIRTEARKMVRELASNAVWFADDDSRTLTFDDANDLCKLARLVADGKHKQAEKFHDNLDTAVRDRVPASVYYYIGGGA